MNHLILASCCGAAVVAFLALSCGTGAHTPGVATVGGATSTAKSGAGKSTTNAAAASRCMRSHGVPNFPDPIDGRFGFTVESGVDPNTQQFRTAFKYCTTRYRIFTHLATPAERARSNAAAVKFSACMRSRGVSDFPDPDRGDGLIELPSATYLSTPKVAHAQAACNSLRMGKGVLFGVPVPSPN